MDWIKKEDMSNSMVLEDPLQVPWCTECIKEECELNLGWPKPENNFIEDPLHVPWCTECVNEKPELHLGWAEGEKNFIEDPLQVAWCSKYVDEKPELHLGWAECEINNSLDRLLDIIQEAERESCPPLLVIPKKELESEHEMPKMKQVTTILVPFIPKEEPVEAPALYESSRTRYIENNGESCDISFKETVYQGIVSDEVNVGAEKATHVSMDNNLKMSQKTQILSAGNHRGQGPSYDDQHMIIIKADTEYSSREEIKKHSSSQGIWETSKNLCNNNCKTNTMFPAGKKPETIDNCCNLSTAGSVKDNAVLHATKRPYNFEISGKSFAGTNELKKNIVKHIDVRTDINKNNVIRSSAQASCRNRNRHQTAPPAVKPLECDTCGAHFSQLRFLKMHILSHTGQRPHTCDICSKCFSSSATLKKHALLHTRIRSYQCDICGKCFTRRYSLKAHRLIHTRERPHKCHIC